MSRLYDVETGEEFSIYVLIKSADIRTDRNGNPFIAFTFQDRSGTMDGMYWSAEPWEVESFQAGRVVFLRGKRELYNGQPQVRIKQLRLAEAGEPNDPMLYMEKARISREEAEKEIEDALYMMHDAKIQRIVRRILHEVGDDFYEFPAAKRNHHARAGGLLEHTLGMLRVGKAMLEIYDFLNPSLLLAGIILHDMGKVYELSGALSTEYTLEGNLIGHIVLMSEKIDQAARELGISTDDESVICLKHMVLASHGELEYASPVVPHLLEAQVLHHIDNMDANIEMIRSALDKTKPGEYSPQVYSLDRRVFYKPKNIK